MGRPGSCAGIATVLLWPFLGIFVCKRASAHSGIAAMKQSRPMTAKGNLGKSEARTISVAPMMDRTDRHCRYFLRLFSPGVRLYTEMVVANAILHGDSARLLRFHQAEHPVALQLGGSEPEELARAAARGARAGYDEINLNIGCPSGRVQSGRFGACLMAEPERVAACVEAMIDAVAVPVTVKTRLGIDEHDDYGFLTRFVRHVADAGCRTLIVHARKAILGGLSPRQNREIPPLRYAAVYRLKRDFPGLEIVLNGGVETPEQVSAHLDKVDGVMLGRAVYHNPYVLSALDRFLVPGSTGPTREEVVARFLPYVAAQLAEGVRLQALVRHMLGLFSSCPGARRWRRALTQGATRPGAGTEVITGALEGMQRVA